MSKIILIGCGRKKLDHGAAAEDIYTGSLFRARVGHAKSTGHPWWIVSAKFGLLEPGTWIDEPYDLKITDLPFVDQCAWRLCVIKDLLDEFPDSTDARAMRKTVVELHMGADYAEALHDVVLAAGMCPAWPTKGLGIGEQMVWYKEQTRRAQWGGR